MWVVEESLNTLLFLLRWSKLIEAPTMPRVPPEAVTVTTTMVLVVRRQIGAAPVSLTREATTNRLGAVLPVPVTQLRQEERFVRGILTKPIKLPLVKVTVRVKAFTNMANPKTPTW